MQDKRNSRALSAIFDWLESLLFGLIFVMVLFSFVFKTYTVDGDSMQPTLKPGDFIFAYSLLYSPAPGDIVIIDASNNYGKPLIKRVVATEGQTVNIDENGNLTVDGEIFPFLGDENKNNIRGDMQFPLTVPKGFVFVMGDNRATSLDSRYSELGYVDVRSIVGREIYTLFT